jgi:hypothetical protein
LGIVTESYNHFYHQQKKAILPTQLPVVSVAMGKKIACAASFFFACQMSNKCLTNVQAVGGKFPHLMRLFFCILVEGISVTKIIKKCLTNV